MCIYITKVYNYILDNRTENVLPAGPKIYANEHTEITTPKSITGSRKFFSNFITN